MTKNVLSTLQRRLFRQFKKVCFKGHGASSFVYAVSKGRAVEISEDRGGFWLEFWEKSDDEDAAPVKEVNVAGRDQAVQESKRWLG